MFPKFNLFRISGREPGGARRGANPGAVRWWWWCSQGETMHSPPFIIHNVRDQPWISSDIRSRPQPPRHLPPRGFVQGKILPLTGKTCDTAECSLKALPTLRPLYRDSLDCSSSQKDYLVPNLFSSKSVLTCGKAKKSFDPELDWYKACCAVLLSNLTSVCLFVLQFGQKYKQLANLLSSALKTVNTNSREKIIDQVSHHLFFHLFLCVLSYGG